MRNERQWRAGVQVAALTRCALIGRRFLHLETGGAQQPPAVPPPRPAGAALLLGSDGALLEVTFRAGARVFGGGHVVLPLLETGSATRFLTRETFAAGYGAANAVPGPLLTFSTQLGTAQPALPACQAAASPWACLCPVRPLMVGRCPSGRVCPRVPPFARRSRG
ncbi:chromate transporter [Deinococcus hopiensis]|uniref:chromate transporter n=1 Tax=Deinococcus hopiensis TaxID=309885 RepID=UPI001FE35FE1|nr:chromate transporter [Deinococcus hopiensis]